jgi:hypothetical protein
MKPLDPSRLSKGCAVCTWIMSSGVSITLRGELSGTCLVGVVPEFTISLMV